METTNLKKLTERVINRDAPHLVAVMDDIFLVNDATMNEVAIEVQKGNKVLIKNFATFELEEREPRPRYDTGLKQVVTTEPKKRMKCTQSPNIFRDEKE